MKILKITKEARVETEQAAKDAIQQATDDAIKGGYIIDSATWTRKTKKSKGTIIDECWIVKFTEVYSSIWDEEE